MDAPLPKLKGPSKPQLAPSSGSKNTTKKAQAKGKSSTLPSISGRVEPRADILEIATPASADVPVLNEIASVTAVDTRVENNVATSEINLDASIMSTVIIAEVAPVIVEPVVVNANGHIVLLYEMYNEQFEIVEGSMTASSIDDVYCLSFVMPKCSIHLSRHSPGERRMRLEAGVAICSDFYEIEEPRGTFRGLVPGCSYHVYIEQEEEQLLRDQAETAMRMSLLDGGNKKKDAIVRDDGRVLESCSCIYGNPCVDEYGCRDWSNRFAIATKNGWKGF